MAQFRRIRTAGTERLRRRRGGDRDDRRRRQRRRRRRRPAFLLTSSNLLSVVVVVVLNKNWRAIATRRAATPAPSRTGSTAAGAVCRCAPQSLRKETETAYSLTLAHIYAIVVAVVRRLRVVAENVWGMVENSVGGLAPTSSVGFKRRRTFQTVARRLDRDVAAFANER